MWHAINVKRPGVAPIINSEPATLLLDGHLLLRMWHEMLIKHYSMVVSLISTSQADTRAQFGFILFFYLFIYMIYI
jgi:hypothetical protein